jgi:hypothetical protein
MSKPVELIVANVLHECAARRERLPIAARALINSHRITRDEALARDLAINIVAHASIANVLQALAAIGAPATLDEVGQRFDAVVEQRGGQRDTQPSASDAHSILGLPPEPSPDQILQTIKETLEGAIPGLVVTPVKIGEV